MNKLRPVSSPHIIIFTLSLALAMSAASADLPPSTANDSQASPTNDSSAYAINGSVDVGALHHTLTGGFPAWNGEFVRGIVHTSESNTINIEVDRFGEFGDQGKLFVIGDTIDLNADWYAAVNIQGSSGGFFLPRRHVDLDLSRKWFAERNLVTSIGLSAIDAKDDHNDRAVHLGAAYYYSVPLVIEGGVSLNQSSPGGIRATSRFVAATYGRDKSGILSVRYSTGRESYQLIGGNSTLVDFPSQSLLVTWRQWIGRDWGTQLRSENYRNPFYHRDGIEVGLFVDF
jgi:YaiO family outer membrane protein